MARARKATEQVEESADAVASKLAAYYQDLLVEVERKVGMTEPTAFNRDRMSTGSACLDLVIGGGIGPGWYTFFGPEGACKTTGALTVMGAAIRQNNVPIIALHDYEGCLLEDTRYRVQGRDIPLNQLFDLTSVNRELGKRWIGQFTQVDTHSNDGKVTSRAAQLFYGGKQMITKVTLEDDTVLEGALHPCFVLEDDQVVEKKIEGLRPGDVLLIKK